MRTAAKPRGGDTHVTTGGGASFELLFTTSFQRQKPESKTRRPGDLPNFSIADYSSSQVKVRVPAIVLVCEDAIPDSLVLYRIGKDSKEFGNFLSS